MQVISEVLHLSRNPEMVRQIADAKEAAFQRIHGTDARPEPMPGAVSLLRSLAFNDVRTQEPPAAVLNCLSPWKASCRCSETPAVLQKPAPQCAPCTSRVAPVLMRSAVSRVEVAATCCHSVLSSCRERRLGLVCGSLSVGKIPAGAECK